MCMFIKSENVFWQLSENIFERFLILELVVACHYLDYTQAFRVFGESGANNSIHDNKEDDPRSATEKLITYVDYAKDLERNGGAPIEAYGSKNYLGGGAAVKGDLGNEESSEKGQLWEHFHLFVRQNLSPDKICETIVIYKLTLWFET